MSSVPEAMSPPDAASTLPRAGTTVLLVEDDPDWAGLASEALARAGYDVQVFAEPRALLERAAWPREGCLLLDVHLPGMDGVELLRELRRRGVRLPAVMMTAFGDVPLAVRAMREGAYDFVEKPLPPDLAERIGGAVAAAAAAHAPPGAGPDGEAAAARLRSLSPRERQIFELVVAGLPNKVIASRLDLSIKTVELHRSRVMRKTEAGSLAELVRLALHAGLDGRQLDGPDRG